MSKNFPSSIEARISTIFQVVNHTPSVSRPSPFTSYERIRGIEIGYRHINICLQTDVMWDKELYAQFPSHGCAGGHQVDLPHQFRGGAGTWIQPKRILSERLETELELRGLAERR